MHFCIPYWIDLENGQKEEWYINGTYYPNSRTDPYLYIDFEEVYQPDRKETLSYGQFIEKNDLGKGFEDQLTTAVQDWANEVYYANDWLTEEGR